jgi:hypothetical protein
MEAAAEEFPVLKTLMQAMEEREALMAVEGVAEGVLQP